MSDTTPGNIISFEKCNKYQNQKNLISSKTAKSLRGKECVQQNNISCSISYPRITRSSSRTWQKTSESKKKVDNLINFSMNPPPSPGLLFTPNRTSGVLTRRQYKSLLHNLSEKDSDKSQTLVCNGDKSFKLSLELITNSSDYGTASESSRNCSLGNEFSPVSSKSNSSCESDSGTSELAPNLDRISANTYGTAEIYKEVDDVCTDLSNTGWDSDSNVVEVDWENKHLQECGEVTILRAGQVTAIIPKINNSGYDGKFSIHLKSRERSKFYRQGLSCGMRVHHVSPIVSVKPHGIQFHDQFPALLVIPIAVEPQEEKWLSCLCSNTPEGHTPDWKHLPQNSYTYSKGTVVITAAHFSLFTIILEEPYPEIMRIIRRRRGGHLRIKEVPGVEVKFPPNCLEIDLDAYLRVLFDSEANIRSDNGRRSRALASPVIMLGPHGHQFSQSRQPVYIQLPVPDYFQIIHRFGNLAKLSVWQSSTGDGEPMVWERLDVPISGPDVVNIDGWLIPVVSFPVHHFSFFKILWDVLSKTLCEAKMGMSYFYPYISFSMMCQAFMEESGDTNRFGLEVICYRSDHRLPEATNYRHRVGASLKPKMVRPGRIIIRLRSQMFEADVEAGEDAEMVKEEPDFRGRDFEKQYACRFKPNVNVERGTFGKVIVDRFIDGDTKDPLFEFNLHKTGNEAEFAQPVGCERWTVFAMKELAASLQITDGNNWKKFAQQIGFTKSEIKNKLQYSSDPFLAMMNMYNSRGGTPEEFVQALYAVSRDIRIHGSGGGSHSEGSGSNRSSGSKNSEGRASSSQDSGGGTARRKLFNFMPWKRALDSDSDSEEPTDKSQKRPHTDIGHKETNAPKRRKFSDISETNTSSSEESKNIKSNSSQNHRKNTRKLSDKDLWHISSKIVRKDWRNLGRTLGIEEQVLLNLEHSHQSIGFRECAYQMLLEWKGRKPRSCTFGDLYNALVREDMIAVAKHMVNSLANEDGGRDSP